MGSSSSAVSSFLMLRRSDCFVDTGEYILHLMSNDRCWIVLIVKPDEGDVYFITVWYLEHILICTVRFPDKTLYMIAVHSMLELSFRH